MQIVFDGWQGIVRILIIAPIAYAILVFFLRVSGKRTLTKLNAFDLVITVALGSTLATQILSRDTPLIDGIVAMAMLIGLQWCVTWTSVRSRRFRDFVRSAPTCLVNAGKIEHATLRAQRITESEVLQGVRRHGHPQIKASLTVFLQSDGSLSVVESRSS
jgi:uncharacterized membrane protein YcaP (DUF421 family)